MGSAIAETETDPAIVEAQAAIDALEAGKVTEPVPDKVTAPAVVKAEAVDYSGVILPKDAIIDAAVLDRTVAIARAQGLSREQAQPMVDLINQEVAHARDDLLASYQPGGAEWTKQVDGWRATTEADTQLGKTPEERKAAIAKGASVLKKYAEQYPADKPALDEFLDASGFGDHPVFARMFHWLGKAAGERLMVTGTNSDLAATPAERMYPTMNP